MNGVDDDGDDDDVQLQLHLPQQHRLLLSPH
jgi:hypothetical protein